MIVFELLHRCHIFTSRLVEKRVWNVK